MIKLGVQIIPVMMSTREIIDTAMAAEALGFDYCLVCDEGIMPDPFVCLGAIAQKTDRIKLGAVTNGYSRHPAVTAMALASLNDLSGGRAQAMLVAGGMPVLAPMGLERQAPLDVMRDTIEIMRRLWSGEAVTWAGNRYQVDSMKFLLGPQDIPIWVAARGPKMLNLAGELADGVVLISKPDLADAFELVDAGRARTGNKPHRIYLDQIAYTPDLLAHAKSAFVYAAIDAPPRMVQSLGLAEKEVAEIKKAFAQGGPHQAGKLVTRKMIAAFQIAGSLAECRNELHALAETHQLDMFILNINASGLADNRQLMSDVRRLVEKRSN
jgi:5,10-methylenetetrahydromethanopterin reductase